MRNSNLSYPDIEMKGWENLDLLVGFFFHLFGAFGGFIL